MQKNLKTLDELQEIDLRLDGISGAKNALIEQIDAIDRRLAEASHEIAEKDEGLALLEGEKKGLEDTLAAETENISRSEGRLKEIKTQKEYQAVSKEISMARKLKVEMEEQILQKISQIDEAKGEIAECRGNFAKLEDNSAARKQELQSEIEALEKGSASDHAARNEKFQSLPPGISKRYTTLREMRRGVAVVEARDGNCLGCNINLPPQMYNTLFRGNELITCPHCQRMLVLRQSDQK